jgi:hypothetical protein
MSDQSQGPGWWMASDGKWYPPETHPDYTPPPPPPPPGPSASASPQLGGWAAPSPQPSAQSGPAPATRAAAQSAPATGRPIEPAWWLLGLATVGSVVGAFLPWVKAAGPFGTSVEVSGADGGDGWFFIVGAVLYGVTALRCRRGSVVSGGGAWLLTLSSVGLILVGLVNLNDVNDRIAEARDLSDGLVDGRPAAGLYLCLAAAVAGLIGTLTGRQSDPV